MLKIEDDKPPPPPNEDNKKPITSNTIVIKLPNENKIGDLKPKNNNQNNDLLSMIKKVNLKKVDPNS